METYRRASGDRGTMPKGVSSPSPEPEKETRKKSAKSS